MEPERDKAEGAPAEAAAGRSWPEARPAAPLAAREAAAPYAHSPAGPAAAPEPGDVEPRRLRVGRDGRLVIPADMRAAMALDGSGLLTAWVAEGTLNVVSPMAALRALQRHLDERVPPGVSLVDELIAERRAEARREDAE